MRGCVSCELYACELCGCVVGDNDFMVTIFLCACELFVCVVCVCECVCVFIFCVYIYIFFSSVCESCEYLCVSCINLISYIHVMIAVVVIMKEIVMCQFFFLERVLFCLD